MNSAQIRTPLLSVMSVGAHNRQQQVLIPILIMGIDKPYIVVRVIEAGGAVVLAFLSGPEVLDIQRVGQVDMPDACQFESFIAADNAGQVIAHLIVIKVCGVIFPIIQRFEKCRDFTAGIRTYLSVVGATGSLPVRTNASNAFCPSRAALRTSR